VKTGNLTKKHLFLRFGKRLWLHKGLVLSLVCLGLLPLLLLLQTSPAVPVEEPEQCYFTGGSSQCAASELPAPEISLPPAKGARVTPMPVEGPPLYLSKPKIAIVIDDLGLDEKHTREAIDLPYALTLSFLPYAPHVQAQAYKAQREGHQIFLHLPMEALNESYAGPDALTLNLDDDELRRRINKNLDAFNGYIGVNNHMGSAFTANERRMRIFLEEISRRGLIYLDSRTTAMTVAEQIANEFGIPFIRRHVFLDHEPGEKYLAEAFKHLKTMAKEQGYAIAIAHPHPITLEFLRKHLPYLASDFELVPAGDLVTAKPD
jgi:polysaccharide deacetylase 2 family uncharacterized protein YibQ